MLKAIIYTNVALFLICLFFSLPKMSWTLNPLYALAPTTDVLNFMGASGRLPILQYGSWWSVFTANWLHGSLLHILFNMMALRTVGPLVIGSFGTMRMFSIYTLAGAAGFIASYLGGVYITVGASSGLCGLIGALVYFGKSKQGGIWGQWVLKQTSGWIISLVLMGFVIPNINNWGHGGGFIGGFIAAWLLRHSGQRMESKGDTILAGVLALATLFFLARPVIQGGLLYFG